MSKKLRLIVGVALVGGMLCGFLLSSAYHTGQSQAGNSSNSRPSDWPLQNIDAPEPVLPAKTPFDGDDKKRDGYLSAFSRGHAWAHGVHLRCPPNPNPALPETMYVIRGWVEGWQAGVEAGGEGELPARYAPYLVWRDDKLGRDASR